MRMSPPGQARGFVIPAPASSLPPSRRPLCCSRRRRLVGGPRRRPEMRERRDFPRRSWRQGTRVAAWPKRVLTVLRLT